MIILGTHHASLFQEERLAAAAGSLVPLSNVLEETINYTKQRKAFGQPLINNQYMAFRLAELNTELELLRAALYQVQQLVTKDMELVVVYYRPLIRC